MYGSQLESLHIYILLDHEGGQKSLGKEAVHIQMRPSQEHFNRDGGLKVSGC